MAVKTDGTLWAWGHNSYGQLGDGTAGTDRLTPVRVGSDTSWASVAAADWHTVAVRTDGTLWAWGHNHDGELGDGTITDRSAPVQVGTDTSWAVVAAGRMAHGGGQDRRHFVGVGFNGSGQLGDGTRGFERWAPGQVGTDTHWASVAASRSHTLGLQQ